MRLYMMLLMLSFLFVADSKIYFVEKTNDLYRQYMNNKYPGSSIDLQDFESYSADAENYRNITDQAIKKVGDDLKADAILPASLYVNPELDISSKVADEINREFTLMKKD